VSGRGRLLSLFLAALLAGAAAPSRAAEPAACLSNDPTQWPPVNKPYVLVIVPTSVPLATSVGSLDTCSFGTTRLSHVTCALHRAFETFSGTIHFGLATSAALQNGTCTGATSFAGNAGGAGCGPEAAPDADSSTRRGANIVEAIPADEVNAPIQVTNAIGLGFWTDNTCSSGTELDAFSTTALNGPLRDAYRYFSNQWVRPDGLVTHNTPLGVNDLACRRLRVVLIAPGDETCDTQANAVDAAADLFAGFSHNGNTFSVRTSVISLGGTLANHNAIAAAGGTGVAFLASNDTTLTNALTSILTGFVSAETCDNADNNCNGCTDEGFRHLGSAGQTCCAWVTVGQRNTCLLNYRASVSGADPDGNPALLPCTTAVQAAEPATWLCYDAKEVCDEVDNNLDGNVDEGMVKCGTPAHCPNSETCNGQDDDCDGAIDEGCTPGPDYGGVEVCDGCDNDGDMMADEDVLAIPCGQTIPGHCAGVLTCKPAQPVAVPGGCAIGGGWNACSNAPQAETCNGVDDDCDGVVDDGIAGVACEPAGTPAGLRYGGSSQCQMGIQYCNQACLGFVGPTPEVTDLIDNDCDGVAEDGLDVIFMDGFDNG
jgi:hypothetical protein